MNSSLVKYGLIAVAIAGFYFYSQYSENKEYTPAAGEIDLNAVLDVTAETIYAYDASLKESEPDPDEAFVGLADQLAVNYNATVPPLYSSTIGVAPLADASLVAFEDTNGDKEMGDNEDPLFQIEIDGDGQRIIASSRSGEINDRHFSGTSLMAGYLIGSLLSRQRAAGVSSSQLANKNTVSPKAAARARAGSGSHSRGK